MSISDRERPDASEARPSRSGSRTGRGSRLSGVVLVVLLLALWECSARLGWVESPNWPPITSVLAAVVDGLAGGEILPPLLSTLRRMAIGYGLGCGAGILLGLLLGASRPARYILQPPIEILRPIPAPAIIPPLILFLGVEDALKIFIVALASFFPVFVNTLAGVAGVDDTLAQTARTFRTSWTRTVLCVTLPATLPSIAAGLRTATSLALVVAVISEMIAGSSGMGFYIVQMQYAMKPGYMYAAVICLAVVGYAINGLFLETERRLIPWMGKA